MIVGQCIAYFYVAFFIARFGDCLGYTGDYFIWHCNEISKTENLENSKSRKFKISNDLKPRKFKISNIQNFENMETKNFIFIFLKFKT